MMQHGIRLVAGLLSNHTAWNSLPADEPKSCLLKPSEDDSTERISCWELWRLTGTVHRLPGRASGQSTVPSTASHVIAGSSCMPLRPSAKLLII